MRIRRLALCFFALSGLAREAPPRFVRHDLPGLPHEIRGAALDGTRLIAWGTTLIEFRLPLGGIRSFGSADYQEGGCLADLDGDGRMDFIAQDGSGLGSLVWRKAPAFRAERIDSEIEMHDCTGATLFGRRGLLMVQRYGQVRFYERPAKPLKRWPYREIYSFYTASRQGGLVLKDIDRDGLTDIICGNYWIRSPKSFELPWRLFAVNTDHETLDSATARFAPIESPTGVLKLVVSQGHKVTAKLSIFTRPNDPTQLWHEQRLNPQGTLVNPHGLDVADFDADGDQDIAVAEKGPEVSRVLIIWNEGEARFRAEKIASGAAVHTLKAVDLNRDGKLDLVAVGPRSVVWWENAYPLRK